MKHKLYSHSPGLGHLGCFWLFAIAKDSVLFDYLLRIDFEMWNYSTFIRLLLSSTKLLLKWIVPVYTSVANVLKISIFSILSNISKQGNLEWGNICI